MFLTPTVAARFLKNSGLWNRYTLADPHGYWEQARRKNTRRTKISVFSAQDHRSSSENRSSMCAVLASLAGALIPENARARTRTSAPRPHVNSSVHRNDSEGG